MKNLFAKLCVAIAVIAVGVALVGDADGQPLSGSDAQQSTMQSAPMSDFGPGVTSGEADHMIDVAITVLTLVAMLVGASALAVYALRVAPNRRKRFDDTEDENET